MDEFTLSQAENGIAKIIVDEVENSQKTEAEYNPFPSQSEAGYNPFPSQSEAGYNPFPSQSATDYNPFPSQSQTEPSTSSQASEPVRWFTAGSESTSEQKKRGRPSKELITKRKVQASRESQRVKKCPSVFTYKSFNDDSLKWSEKDKALFLKGCLEVGIENIEGLQRHLPHKSEKDIRRQIEMWKAIAAEKLKKQLSKEDSELDPEQKQLKNLDNWIEYFHEKAKNSSDNPFIFSDFFLLVAEYGVFPSPEECGGVDARAMYRYLHCMMKGVPPYGINRVTAKVILMCLDNVFNMLKDPDVISNLQEHILNPAPIPDTGKFGKTYSRKGKNAKDIDYILQNPIMNPLRLPKEALYMPNPKDSAESVDSDDSD